MVQNLLSSSTDLVVLSGTTNGADASNNETMCNLYGKMINKVVIVTVVVLFGVVGLMVILYRRRNDSAGLEWFALAMESGRAFIAGPSCTVLG